MTTKRPRGRPALINKEEIKLTITSDVLAWLKLAGEGNASSGIRRAYKILKKRDLPLPKE